MDLQLGGKRALVTGGSSGIGKAIARQLAREGCDVVIAARTMADLEKTAAELARETGRKVIPIAADTSDDSSVRDLVAGAVAALGGIDILVNAAAKVNQGGAPGLAGITDAVFYGDVNVKVMGYLRVAREAAPLMVKAGWGRIVNVSGLAARKTGSIVGSVRNVAVAAMTKNMADELGGTGVNVVCVHPGLTRTERTPDMMAKRGAAAGLSPEAMEKEMAKSVSIGRVVDAEEVAFVVAFLASPLSVSINGEAIACGGGDRGAIHY